MKKIHIFLLLLLIGSANFAQVSIITAPKSIATGAEPDWTKPFSKTAVDTCGAYFNNYTGLVKTTDIYFEELRRGGTGDFDPYSGRGQRFHANQPIEVSGLQFYSFQNNPLLDSLMVITLLLDYDEVNDSIGVELARDTVWVSHPSFTPLLVDLEVNSYFDTPVTVEEDYIVALYTPTNDSLKIITNDPGGDGGGEGVSFAYYNNPVAPAYTGWYATLPVFGPGYDLDYLINPLVRYKLHDDFSLNSDTVCPSIISAACTEYMQVPNFSDPHYNRFYATPNTKIRWNWGDGFQNSMTTALCHTYNESGTFTITLIDSIRRHDFMDFTCAVERTKTIVVLDSVTISAAGTSTGLTASFNGLASPADSIHWDFGDESEGSDELNPSHTYTDLGTYGVWFYAYGPCNTDSVMVTITLDDLGLTENKLRVNLYPNPANQHVILSGVTANTKIELVNILGEILFSEKCSGSEFSINTASYSQGTYFIRMTNDDLQLTRKLIIRH